MKMKKFIPLLALSMLLTVPAFADPDPATDPSSDTTLQSILTFTVPNFFKIHRVTSNQTSAVTIGDHYDSLTITTPLVAHYEVYTNVGTGDQKFNIKAQCAASDDATHNALKKDDSGNYTIVFANTASGNIPTATQVEAAKGPDGTVGGADNPNAITFTFSHLVNRLANSAAGVTTDTEITPAKAGDKLTYTVGNGIYDCLYTIGTTAQTNTFSTADTEGTYQATIIITKGEA